MKEPKSTDEIRAEITKRLIDAVNASGMKPFTVAQMSGLSPAAIGNYLSGKRTPGIEEIAKIAEVIGASAMYLTGLKDYGRKALHAVKEGEDMDDEIEGNGALWRKRAKEAESKLEYLKKVLRLVLSETETLSPNRLRSELPQTTTGELEEKFGRTNSTVTSQAGRAANALLGGKKRPES